MQENKIVAIIEESGLAPAQAKPLLDNFGDFFVKAHKLVAKAGAVKVTSEDQKDEMKKARELRLALREVRVEANKMRVKLKEGYLRGGNAVQAIYNDIEKITKPEEERLEQAEKFAEIKEAERKQARYEKRVAELGQYVSDTSIYQLKDMADESYKQLLADSKASHEARLQAEKKAEEERLENERLEKLENKRRFEIAPFIEFVDKNLDSDEKLEKYLWHASEEDYQSILKKAMAARKKYNDEQEALRVQAEKDRRAREEAERKLKEEQDRIAENQRIAREQLLAEEAAAAKAKAEEEEKRRQKLLAPDKEKLQDLANQIEALGLPAVQSKEAGAVIRATEDMLGKVTNYIREKAKTL